MQNKPTPKPVPKPFAAKPELKADAGLNLGDTAEVVASLGKKYEGRRGEVTLLDPRVHGVVLSFDGVKEFFLDSDVKKV
jgi:hypothetical protein